MTVEIKSFAQSPTARSETIRLFFLRYADVWLMLALALFTAAYSLQYDILRQPIPHDTTFHIYAAQQMLDGHPIYRDVGIIKAPLSDFAAAFAIIIARLIHISDIMGTRLLSLFVAMAVTSATYLAGRVLFKSRAVGVIAGLIMASWNFYGLRALTGPEPKEFVILFSLLALVCIAQKRWVLAGAAAALSTLAWQPALMMQAIAMAAAFIAPWLMKKRGQTKQPMRAALLGTGRVLLGFAIPFALVVLYLLLNDALVAGYNATIGANLFHFNNNQARVPILQTVDENFAEILTDGSLYCFSFNEYWLVGLGALGFVGLVGSQIVGAVRAKRLPVNLEFTPLILYGLGFTAFSLIDFDYCPDLLPLVPVLALTAGWLIVLGICGIASLIASFSANSGSASAAAPSVRARSIERLLLIVVGLLLVVVYWFDAWGYQVEGVSFLDQLEVVQVATMYLSPGDRVLSFGNTIVPIQLHLQNASKILHLGSKSGLGVLASEPGGVQGMIAALDHDPPKVITLARENRPAWTEPFYEWLEMHYETVQVFPRANMRLFVFKE